MTEERLKQYIEGKRQGKVAEPFKVPEGYFDTLCDRVMGQLPEKQVAVRRTLIPRFWRYAAAAVLVGVVVSVSVLVPHLRSDKNAQLASAQFNEEYQMSGYDAEYMEDVLDYTMLDNSEIAAYLTEY